MDARITVTSWNKGHAEWQQVITAKTLAAARRKAYKLVDGCGVDRKAVVVTSKIMDREWWQI